MCSVAGEMLASYASPSYYFGWGNRRGLEPRRPCLVPTPPPPRTKKRVVFADDRGLSLTQVRTMTEPSNLPPAWSSQFISRITKEMEEAQCESWELGFTQPASDYIEFRRRLDQENVSLENLAVKESEEAAMGTVKVRNLSYEKVVTVRFTLDDWASFSDLATSYVPNSLSSSSVTVLYDTFHFRLPLPHSANRVEFCVSFRCQGQEFWDNNHQRNYRLTRRIGSKEVIHRPPPHHEPLPWPDTPYW